MSDFEKLINASDLIEWIMETNPDWCVGAVRSIVDHVNSMRDAQPERKKGKWVIHPEVKHMYGGIYIECSECHTKYVVQHIEDEKYCRNCGAEMAEK